VQGHYAANDDFADPETVRKLEEELKGLGKEVEFYTYPGVGHAFTNHHRPDVFHEEHSETAWRRTIDFFRRHLSS
jgi:carboxymethylenebutenolidase